MASGSIRPASVPSGCERHINTGAADELAAIRQSLLNYLIRKQEVWVPWWMFFMPQPDQTPITACWCIVLLHRNLQRGLTLMTQKTFKKICLQLSSLPVSGFKSLRKSMWKAWVLMNAFKGYKLNTQGEGFMRILEHKRSPSKMGRHYSEIQRYLAVNYQKPEFLIRILEKTLRVFQQIVKWFVSSYCRHLSRWEEVHSRNACFFPLGGRAHEGDSL